VTPASVITIGPVAPTVPTSGIFWLDTTTATQPVLKLRNGTTWLTIGNVVGPVTSTDNAVARFDGTTGKIIQDSGVIVDDTNNMTVPGNITVNGNSILGNAAVDTITANASTMATPNGLNIDANTLVIDAAKNHVGIGLAVPAAKLDIDNGTVTTAIPVLQMKEIWNSATVMFTSILMNVTKTLADASSELINLKVGNLSRFMVQERGYMKVSAPTRDIFITDAAVPDPVQQSFDAAGNSIFEVASAGTIKTKDISVTSLAGKWKLGSVHTGAAVVDATKFIEVEINGTVVKLAVIA
jgi:hypothetical protein